MGKDSNLHGVQIKLAKEKGLKRGDPGWPECPKRRPLSESHKKAISKGRSRQILEDLMSDPSTPPSVRVQAAAKLLDKEEASLSTVDSTLKDVTEKMTEEQLVAKLRGLIEEDPTLVSKILGDSARGSEGPKLAKTGTET